MAAKYVIIGNSAAAIHAVHAIREIDRGGSITLVSAETCCAYSPALLTYYVAGHVDKKEIFFAGDEFYRSKHVQLILGKKATHLDPKHRSVLLHDGARIEYEKLLIATGSSPKRLEIPGCTLEHVFVLKTLDDAERIVRHVDSKKNYVIIGGGLIGMQSLYAIHSRVRHCTLIIGSSHPLSQNIDQRCGEYLVKALEQRGVSVRTRTDVRSIERTGSRLTLELSNGDAIQAHGVIVGKGVTPNTQLVHGSPIGLDRGILADETMRTTCAGVFAAGDVAQAPELLTGEARMDATWPSACRQGRVAGSNMAGGRSFYSGLAGNITAFFGTKIASIGVTATRDGRSSNAVYDNPREGVYRKLVWNEAGEITGAVLMGRVGDVGVIGHLVRERASIPHRLRSQFARGPVRFADVVSQKRRPLSAWSARPHDFRDG